MAEEAVLEIVRRYADVVRHALPVRAVVLFGSYANGTPRRDSDVDVAVELTSPPDNLRETTLALWRLRHQVDARIEPVLIDSHDDPSGFAGEVKRHGRLVWPARGARRRLRPGRRAIVSRRAPC